MRKNLEDYLYYNEVILGKSYNTIRSYRNDIRQLIEYLEENENITAQNVAEAIQYRSLDRKYWGN